LFIALKRRLSTRRNTPKEKSKCNIGFSVSLFDVALIPFLRLLSHALMNIPFPFLAFFSYYLWIFQLSKCYDFMVLMGEL